MRLIYIFLMSILFCGCALLSPKLSQNEYIDNFDSSKFAGLWYEIGAITKEKDYADKVFKFNFEDNKLLIENRYKTSSNQVNTEKITAISEKDDNSSRFFIKNGFSKQRYNVVKVDPFYEYALIFGKKQTNMWIISRKKTIPEVIKTVFINQAKANGYDTSMIYWTPQK